MKSPELPRLEEVELAAEGLRDVLVRTPLVPLTETEEGQRILLKPEIHQPAGSFKIRGVYHAVASLRRCYEISGAFRRGIVVCGKAR